MKQFEIRWAHLPAPVGKRPVMLLSRTPAYEYLSSVIVVEITSKVRSIPQELILDTREGLPRRCVASFDNVHVVPKRLIRDRIGALQGHRWTEAKAALGHALGWPELMALEPFDAAND